MKWRRDLSGKDLSGEGHRGADFSHVNLSNAQLKGAHCALADFRYANLRGANLVGAHIFRADLRHANLQEANLNRAFLGEVDFRGADLQGASLCFADLRQANLRGANLDGANVGATAIPTSREWTASLNELLTSFAKENLPSLDIDRIEALLSLTPKTCIPGEDVWIGYHLFEFDYTDSVVLDCPVEGIPTFVLPANWREILRNGEPQNFHRKYRGQSTKIVHKGNWLERVRRALYQPIGVRVKEVPWEILPQGTWGPDELAKFYRKYAKTNQEARLCHERLTAIQARFKPFECLRGPQRTRRWNEELPGWQGYHVFRFKRTEKVIAECPMEGNAVYILSGKWKEMIQHSKKYIRDHYPDDYTKVVHKGDTQAWLTRVSKALKRTPVR